MKQYDETKVQIRNSMDEELPRLTLAYTSLNDLKLLLPFVTMLRSENFRLNIELTKVACKDIESYVTKGISDMSLSFGDEFKAPELDRVIIKSGNYSALVAEGHPLFNYDFITIEQLYKYPLLMLSEDSMGETFNTMKERSLEMVMFLISLVR